MVTVAEAEKIIQSTTTDYGAETVPFEQSLGRVVAEEIVADRDLPPYNRVTMDGIAISYKAIEQGVKTFTIKATQAAGDEPKEITSVDECIEIMTGAALPETTDTIIRYEDVEIINGTATLLVDTIKQGQNIHRKGSDKKEDEVVVKANQIITPAIISMAASVGKTELAVKKNPKVVIISTGDELVEVDETPTPYQIRRSNNYTIKATLAQHCLEADMLHIPDEPSIINEQISSCLKRYDVIILSGGISMGKFDYLPKALEELGVQKLFHKVQQRPGKPFWFGKHTNGTIVFAFPGNPVSTFMCLTRYFIPWLTTSLGLTVPKPVYAMLNTDFTFTPALQYFLQVRLSVNESGQILATPVEGNGSGDFANLVDSDAFIELPAERNNFMKGEVYRVRPFKNVLC
jgi:molybdopterin molybdotransferase